MKYFSTRNKDNISTSKEAIIKGIAEDGGLFVPERIPSLPPLKDLLKCDYKELAYRILGLYLTDYSEKELRSAVDGAYDDKFRRDNAVDLKGTDKAYILELFHGPTLAFKDMALSILPHLLRSALKEKKLDKEVVILTATSGDTGKAALEGFKDIEGLNIMVFYPHGGVSPIQRLQMITQEGKNTFVSAIRGNFDDAQNGVKDIFADKEYNSRLDEEGYILSSANSINIGRLIPQIIYYVYGYLELMRREEIKEGERINIVVPTGNFGNILAAYYAKKMGLPVNKLICASNENKVLADFFNSGSYDRKRELLLTSSPSMDILVSSNLERFLFHLSNGDEDLVKEKMEDLKSTGNYDWKDFSEENIYGNYSSEEETSRWINKLYREENYLMDPHTAVAYGVYMKHLKETKDQAKTIIASTASPFKFHEKVLNSIGERLSKDEFEDLRYLSELMDQELPKEMAELEGLDHLHNDIVNKDEMKDIILRFLKEKEDV